MVHPLYSQCIKGNHNSQQVYEAHFLLTTQSSNQKLKDFGLIFPFQRNVDELFSLKQLIKKLIKASLPPTKSRRKLILKTVRCVKLSVQYVTTTHMMVILLSGHGNQTITRVKND